MKIRPAAAYYHALIRALAILAASLLFLTPSLFAASPGRAETAAKGRLFTARPAARARTLTGFTRADTVMSLTSEVAGKVKEVLADVGDPVGADGVFARLDPTFSKLDLKQNLVEQAKLRTSIAYFKTETGRYRSLVKKDSAAQATLDKIALDLDTALHSLDNLRVAEKRLRERLDRFTIKAPPGWLIISRSAEPGEWVNVGQELAVAGDFSRLIARFALSPEELARLEGRNGPIELEVPDYGGKAKAVLDRVSPAFDPETRKIGVELAVVSGLEPMRGGTRLELTIRVPEKSGSVLVAGDCVSKRYEEHFLVRENGERVKVVALGSEEGGLVKVASPEIKAGDVFLRDQNRPDADRPESEAPGKN